MNKIDSGLVKIEYSIDSLPCQTAIIVRRTFCRLSLKNITPGKPFLSWVIMGFKNIFLIDIAVSNDL